jgi:HD-GYP domain-containing protein (c-di-GMP phosphodiesterase class II)
MPKKKPIKSRKKSATKASRARETQKRTEKELKELLQIGVALSSERDVDSLLSLILSKAREITNADAGSLYLMEESESGEKHLRFKLTQNDSIQFLFKESTIPLAETSMAGHVALRGAAINLPDAYKIPPERPYRFNNSFDRNSGYRTRSVLTLPMRNARDQILGVLQLINCKRNASARLKTAADVKREVIPFSANSVNLGLSLASQAAVAYENSKLYDEIQRLFEGFVGASVTAIEQRDPATSGHSFRVSSLTLGLAEIVDAVQAGKYKATRFTREQMKEIRYAALLHDFGKVGVREDVLVKAKKLYPWQLDLVKSRFDFIGKGIEAGTALKKLELILERGREATASELAALDKEFAHRLKQVDDDLKFVLEVNEPTVLHSAVLDRINKIARQTFTDSKGAAHPYLSENEVTMLSIPRGSLDEDERRQIESHVTYTFKFLEEIPWTRELRGIPRIARAHHEKLNGKGYPDGLHDADIPLPTKMMTICDIFDALNAADRPYKAAVPVDRALKILEESVRENELDPELFRLFLESKVYERTAK